jgi:hypothetical protein
MRRRLLLVICQACVFLCVSAARRSDANIGGFFDWLGELSGPGPFRTHKPANIFFADLVCLEARHPSDDDRDYKVAEAELNQPATPVASTWNFGCRGDLRRPRQSYGVLTGWYPTAKVPAAYAYSPEQQALPSGITAIPLAVTFGSTLPFVSANHKRWLRSVDIGTSAGVIFFKAEREKDGRGRFSSFAVPYFEAPRVTIRPLAGLSCNATTCPGRSKLADALQVEVLLRVIGGVTSEQFGATPGVNTGLHVNPRVRIGFIYPF